MRIERLLQAARERLVVLVDSAVLIEAAKLLGSGSDLVIVCGSDGILQGVVTKSDIVKQISVCQGARCLRPVSSVMTRDVAVCRVADRLEDISELMAQRHWKNMPIVDADTRPIGVLTAQAALRSLLNDAQYEEAPRVNFVQGVGYR